MLDIFKGLFFWIIIPAIFWTLTFLFPKIMITLLLVFILFCLVMFLCFNHGPGGRG